MNKIVTDYLNSLRGRGVRILEIKASDLPDNIGWIHFIKEISINNNLVKTGKVLPGPACVIEFHDSESWDASKDCTRKLIQYGLTRNDIILLKSKFINQSCVKSDTNFIRFCLCENADLKKMVLIPDNWEPSKKTVDTLKSNGVDINFITKFIIGYRDSNKRVACADSDFAAICEREWKEKQSKVGKACTIDPDWMPADKTAGVLLGAGISDVEIKILALEFKIYWTDVAGKCEDWDGRFETWGIQEMRNPKRVKLIQCQSN